MTKPIAFIGLDPGISGALALLHPVEDRSRTWDLPIKKVPAPGNKRTKGGKLRYRSLIDEDAVLEALRRITNECKDLDLVAVVEAVSPQRHKAVRGGQQVSISEGPLGAFNFGASWGLMRGLIKAFCPYVLVYPVSWRVKMLGVGASKDAAMKRAVEICPHLSFPRKKDEHRAEALLLAVYGRDYMTPVYTENQLTALAPKASGPQKGLSNDTRRVCTGRRNARRNNSPRR